MVSRQPDTFHPLNAFISGLQPLRFFYKIITQPLTTFLKLLQKANRHIVVKSVIISKKTGENKKTIKEEKTICLSSLKTLKNDKPKGDRPPSR